MPTVNALLGMHLKQLQTSWEEFAKEDSMWAILTDPRRKGRTWTPHEFFATGQADIDALMACLDSLQIRVSVDTALDFGCGIGRLSQGLCRYFTKVNGVDISASMIEAAKSYNQHGHQCTYHLNTKPNLKLFSDSSMTFVYTVITLQHIPGHIQQRYVEEFFRLLKPGGVAVFQTLYSSSAWRFVPARIVDLWRIIRHRGRPFMGAYGLPVVKVIKLIRAAGCNLIELRSSPCDDETRFRWLATRYFVVKPT